jgi:cyanophycin synthetase
MKILETRVYRGPNLYARWPMIRLRLDLGELERYPTAKLPGFADRLLAAMPTLAQHGCSYGEDGGFVRRMQEDEGTWLGHVLEHVAIELQCLAGTPVTFGKTRGDGLPKGEYHVVYSFVEEAVGLAAADLASSLLRHLLPPERAAHDPSPFDFALELEGLVRLAGRRAFGPSTAALVRAAERRGIPWMRLGEGSLVQLGYGRHQKRIQATLTSETRQIATEIASDKRLTQRILEQIALPVPRQASAGDAEEAVEPQTGNDYRILVVDGRVVAAAQRVPGHVVGDGASTIGELVAAVNRDPRRGIGHEKALTRLEIDEQAERLLAEAGRTLTSVLAEGEVFYLRATGNLSTGGTAIDRTDVLHEENRIMAERAVKAVGLDVGGVDFVSPDIARSYREVGGAIVEVNAAPGFRMHLAPTEGKARDVARPVIDMLFPRGASSRIPLAAVTGTHGKTTTTRMVGHILKLAGFTVGMATADGVYIDGTRTVRGDMTGPWSSQTVLRDPTIDAAVLETARAGIVRSGLGWSHCNVGAVLNVAADPLGSSGGEDLDDLAKVKAVVVEAADDYCVLNADDERVAAMAAVSRAQPIYVTTDPHNERVREHVQTGGQAVVLEAGLNGRMLALYLGERGERQVPLLWARQIPATREGKAFHNVQNAMFAAAIAHGMGVAVETIRQGLRSFSNDLFQGDSTAPGEGSGRRFLLGSRPLRGLAPDPAPQALPTPESAPAPPRVGCGSAGSAGRPPARRRGPCGRRRAPNRRARAALRGRRGGAARPRG